MRSASGGVENDVELALAPDELPAAPGGHGSHSTGPPRRPTAEGPPSPTARPPPGRARAAYSRHDARAPPSQHAERADRRGVALLHEVPSRDGLSVRARARPSEAPRSQQAAAPHGSPHRVLHEVGRARARPVRRRRRHTPGRGHRPRSAPRHRLRAGNPAWASVYEEVVRELAAERDGAGPQLADLGSADPGGERGFDPGGCEMRVGDALALLPALPDASVDFVATDPPYTVQLPLTMAGGRARRGPRQPPDRLRDGLRRSCGPRQRRRPRRLPRRDGARLRRDRPGAPAGPLRRGHRPRCLRLGRLPVHRGRARGAGRGSRPRAEGRPHLVQAGTRLRPYGYPRVFVPNIAHQHIVVLRREPEPRRRPRRRAEPGGLGEPGASDDQARPRAAR